VQISSHNEQSNARATPEALYNRFKETRRYNGVSYDDFWRLEVEEAQGEVLMDIVNIAIDMLIDCLTARQHRKVNLCQQRGMETSSGG